VTGIVRVSFAWWMAAAAAVGGGLCLIAAARTPEARSWRAVEPLGPWSRALLGRLDTARSDLTRLAASSAAVTGETSAPRPEIIRELQEFLSLHSWCRGIFVVPANARPLLVLGEHSEVRCNPGHAELARLVDEGEGFIALASGEPPRLCLGVAMAGEAGRRTAILGEVDPEMLLDGLQSFAPATPRPFVTDGRGRAVIGQPANVATPQAVGLAVRLTGWSGPAAGTWRVSAAEAAAASPIAPPPGLVLVGGLLLALALTTAGVVRVVVGRRGSTRRPEHGPDPVRLPNGTLRRPLVLQDRRGVYCACNAAFEDLVGRPRREIIGRTAFDVMPHPLAETDVRVDMELLESGGSRRCETRVWNAEGIPREILVSKAAVAGRDGRPAGICAVYLDITGRRSTETPRAADAPARRPEAPVAARPQETPAPATRAGRARGIPGCARKPWRALVAEDNPVSQRLVAAQVRRSGGEVDVVGDGREAIEAAATRRYDIVFMDCRMPGMDGLEATREIRRQEGSGTRAPIVAVTANALPGDRERCLAAGMDGYLAKPVRSHELQRVIERHVFGAEDEDEEPSTALSSTDSLPVVDAEALERLKALDAEGPTGFLADLAREFDQGFHVRLEEMRTATQDDDTPLLESAAHGLKGSAGVLGARALAERCRQLECLARRGALTEAASLVAGLPDAHASVMSTLEAAVAAPAEAPPVAPTDAGHDRRSAA
jgi:PAS domain S-box-containing protein